MVKRRIMIVDDEPAICRVYSQALDGFEVECFPDGFAALGALFGAMRHYDLLIVDLVLPGMDGATFTRVVRAIEARALNRQRMRVILSTGFSPDRVGVEALALRVDCDGFLGKPVSLELLLQAVSGQLRPTEPQRKA